MDYKYYKYCIVPQCESTTIKTQKKLFIHVPKKDLIRKKWLQLARRDPNLSTDSRMYFCEDHFDLPKDMENYMEYHIMGSVSQIRLKPGCFPSKFDCQPDSRKRKYNEPESPLKKSRNVHKQPKISIKIKSLEQLIEKSVSCDHKEVAFLNIEDQKDSVPVEMEENNADIFKKSANIEKESSSITSDISPRIDLKIKSRKLEKHSRVVPRSLAKCKIRRKVKEDEQFKIGNFYCEICNKSFKRKENLTSHKKNPTHIVELSTNEEIETLAKENEEEESENVFENMKLNIEECNIVKVEHSEKIKIENDLSLIETSKHKEVTIDSAEKGMIKNTNKCNLAEFDNEENNLNKDNLLNIVKKEISDMEDASYENSISESEIQPFEEIFIKSEPTS